MAGTTYTRTQVRQEGLRIWPSLGWAATTDSVTTTAIVDVSEFDHSSYGSNEFAGYFINRYALSGNDKVKRAGKASLTQSTGSLAHDSTTPYSDTTSLLYELLGVPPQVLDDGINQAQQKRYTEQIRLLTKAVDADGNIADMDMQSTGVLMWGTTAGTTSNVTPLKVTTSGNVTNLGQSLRVTGDAANANGYQRSAKFRVNPREYFYTCMIGRADIGTITFKMWDATNSAYIMTANDVAYTGEQFAVMTRKDVAPDGCEEVQIEIRLTGVNDVAVVNGISGPWIYGTRRIELPQWLNEMYKVRFVKPARYTGLTNSFSNLFNADSRDFMGDYQQPQDFFVEAFHRDINGYQLQIISNQLMSDLQNWPIWLSVERSRALDEPLDTESGTTTEDDLVDLMNYVLYEWASSLATMRPEDPKWKALKQEYALLTATTVLAHPPPPQTKPRGMHVVRI